MVSQYLKLKYFSTWFWKYLRCQSYNFELLAKYMTLFSVFSPSENVIKPFYSLQVAKLIDSSIFEDDSKSLYSLQLKRKRGKLVSSHYHYLSLKLKKNKQTNTHLCCRTLKLIMSWWFLGAHCVLMFLNICENVSIM